MTAASSLPVPITVSFGHTIPELILAVGALALVLVGAIRNRDSGGIVTGFAYGTLATALLVLVFEHPTRAVVWNGLFVDDAFGHFMKGLIVIAALVSLLMGQAYLKREKIDKFEFPILILLSTLGSMVLVSATSLITLYLGLELMSLALYVLAAFHRDNVRASEAGLKYFVLGSLSSGMLLYGASFLYGVSGTVSFAGIAATLSGKVALETVLGLVFLMAGLAFKMSVAPFHMWTPDVYQGAPTPVTLFFATVPKVAAVAVTVRVIVIAFPGITLQWQQIIVFLSIMSMVFGSFGAIGQTNIKRLMAYSSIAHMGFALVGLAAGTQEGVEGVAIYMAIYVAMTLGTFAVILSMKVGDRDVENINDLRGISKSDPAMAFFLAVMMFSLAGVPPLAGFFAKFYVFAAAVHAHLYALAIIGMLMSAVAAFYYLRIINFLYFDEATNRFDKQSLTLRTVMSVTGVLVLFLFLFPPALINAATVAAKSLF